MFIRPFRSDLKKCLMEPRPPWAWGSRSNYLWQTVKKYFRSHFHSFRRRNDTILVTKPLQRA